MVDLTSRLPASVQIFNDKYPKSQIKLLGKCEFMNPTMSHKDRIAKYILCCAEKRGDLIAHDGSKKIILAASSGNTGCSIAFVGTMLGYKVSIITNSKCSKEKQNLIKLHGATLWLAETLHMKFPLIIGSETNYMNQEKLLVSAFPDKFFSVNQYENIDNMNAHYWGTGREIWHQTQGHVTHFCMTASTGGTIQGVGRYLKERKSEIEVVLVDPRKSHLAGFIVKRDNEEAGIAILKNVDEIIINEGHVKIEGAGKGSLTGIMRHGGVFKYVDRCVVVNDFDSFEECRHMVSFGLTTGGSSGLNLCGCKLIAEQCAKEEPRIGGVTIVTILCDNGLKYLSTVFNHEENLEQIHEKEISVSYYSTSEKNNFGTSALENFVK